MNETGCKFAGGPNPCDFVAMSVNRLDKVCLYCGQTPAQAEARCPKQSVTIWVTKAEFDALKALMPHIFRT